MIIIIIKIIFRKIFLYKGNFIQTGFSRVQKQQGTLSEKENNHLRHFPVLTTSGRVMMKLTSLILPLKGNQVNFNLCLARPFSVLL